MRTDWQRSAEFHCTHHTSHLEESSAGLLILRQIEVRNITAALRSVAPLSQLFYLATSPAPDIPHLVITSILALLQHVLFVLAALSARAHLVPRTLMFARLIIYHCVAWPLLAMSL